MEKPAEKPDRWPRRRSFKSKAATLPAGAVLMDQPGEGFFSKIRRSFRIRKKTQKFLIQHSLDDTQDSARTDSSGQSSSTDHPHKTDIIERMKGRLKTSQKNDCAATGSIVLVSSKERRHSPSTSHWPSSAQKAVSRAEPSDEGDQLLLQTEQEVGAQASAMYPVTENNNNVKYFDDFDPDYETLDNIRQQLQNRNDGGHNFPTTKSGNNANMFEVNDSHGIGKREQDNSALNTNTGIAQEKRSHSLTDLSTHIGPLASGCSDLPSIKATNSFFEDDLYANAKVLMRKQQQKLNEMSSDVTNISHPKSISCTSFSESRDVQQSESMESFFPPPLPARNYSEQEVATRVDTAFISEDFSQEQKPAITKYQSDSNRDRPHLTLSTVSDDTNILSKSDTPSDSDGVVSEPFRRNSVFVEVGPVIVLNTAQCSPAGNICERDLLDRQLTLPCSEWPQTLLKSTSNTLVADGEKHDIDKSAPQKVSKTLEELEKDLLFIDEEPAENHDQQMKGTKQSYCVRDAGSEAAASNGCREGIAGDLMESKDTRDGACAGQHITSAGRPVSVTLEGAQGLRMSSKLKRRNSQEQTVPNSLGSDCAFSKLDSKPTRCSTERPIPQPRQKSSIPADTIQASSASADLLPPPLPPHRTESSVHMRQVSSRRCEGAVSLVPIRPQSAQLSRHFFPLTPADCPPDETPPPLPPAFRRNCAGGASGRKAVSEELPLRRTKGSDQGQELHKNYRHSSVVDASRAHSDFVKSMRQLKECGWYWGPLSSDEAVSKLTDKCDGSFLVRDSTSDKYLLTISFKFNGHVHHTRIEFHKGLFSFWEQPDEQSKAHICQFIEQTVEHSKKGNFIYFQRSANSTTNPLPIQLLYPVSRFYRVPSLQHMCRFQILCRIRRDHIDCLPLPQKVKDYLSEKQYYVEMLTED